LGTISVPVNCSARKTPSFIWEGLVKQNTARLGGYFQSEEEAGNRYSVPKSEVFPPEVDSLLAKNKCLFSNLGSGIMGFTGSLTLEPDVKPIIQKDRPVPYSLVSEVE